MADRPARTWLSDAVAGGMIRRGDPVTLAYSRLGGIYPIATVVEVAERGTATPPAEVA
jgi:hypothetical protein